MMPAFDFSLVLFYAFALVMVLSSVAVISVRNPVYAALWLVLTFFTAAALWMLLEAEFLAIVLIVVYVGAVMVLFLFVVMMLDINLAPMNEGFTRYLWLGVLVALVMAGELLSVLWARDRLGSEFFPSPAQHELGYSNTEAVGQWLYTHYLLPFEVAGIILLVAIIAAVALTLRSRGQVKTQNPAHQVRIKRAERVRLVNMPSATRRGEES